tara:strand:+ start:15255 stop:15533 length:279 start_codon:yes stop_codon:yes gene_type:complete
MSPAVLQIRLNINCQGVTGFFAIPDGFLESTQGATQVTTDTAQPLRAEQQHHYHQNNQQRADTYSTYTHDYYSRNKDDARLGVAAKLPAARP